MTTTKSRWMLTCAFLAAAAPAAAAPAKPKVVVADTDSLVPAKKFTIASAAARRPGFAPTKTYKTASGGTITGQQYIDMANRLQAAAEKGGCDLGSGKPCNFVVSDAKLSTAELNQTAQLAGYKLGFKKLTAPPRTASERQAKDPLGFSWSNEWGRHSTGAVYVSAAFGNDASSHASGCGGSASAGVWLFGTKKEVVRLEGEASASGSSVLASAELFVVGDSVWSKTGTFSTSKLAFEKSFSVSKSFTYWGLVTINLKAKTTGSAFVDGSIRGTSGSGEYTCAVAITPGVKATVTGSAEVAVLGYGDLSAAAVGVEADVKLADLSLPLTASVTARNVGGRVSVSESLAANLNMRYLDGSLEAYFKTSFPLDGEKVWDWDADRFTFTLLEWDGASYEKTLFSKTQTQTL